MGNEDDRDEFSSLVLADDFKVHEKTKRLKERGAQSVRLIDDEDRIRSSSVEIENFLVKGIDRERKLGPQCVRLLCIGQLFFEILGVFVADKPGLSWMPLDRVNRKNENVVVVRVLFVK